METKKINLTFGIDTEHRVAAKLYIMVLGNLMAQERGGILECMEIINKGLGLTMAESIERLRGFINDKELLIKAEQIPEVKKPAYAQGLNREQWVDLVNKEVNPNKQAVMALEYRQYKIAHQKAAESFYKTNGKQVLSDTFSSEELANMLGQNLSHLFKMYNKIS